MSNFNFIIKKNYELSSRGRFGYVPDPDCEEYCHDACKNETLCESCKFFSEHHGIPMCCGNEYERKENPYDEDEN